MFAEHSLLGLLAGVRDHDLEHEAVELRERQRIRPFLLDGVLRRERDERIGERMRDSVVSDSEFLHRFQQCRLSTG